MKCYEVIVELLGAIEFEGILCEYEGKLKIECKIDESEYAAMFEELYHDGHIKYIPKKNNCRYDEYDIEKIKFNSLKEVLEYCKKDFDLSYKEI